MTPIFSSRLSIPDILEGGFYIIFGLIGTIKFSLEITHNRVLESIFLIGFFSLLIVQGLRITKTFLLFKDNLVIRRPWTVTTKTDLIFPTSEIKEIIFRKIKGRFGGPHILILSKTKDISFRIGCNDQEIKEFIIKLNSLSIKTTLDNWTIDNEKISKAAPNKG